MKTILVTAYAVHPYKGSEDAMGWNMILQAAAHNRIIAVTRKNNRAAIESYIHSQPGRHDLFERIQFMYFDWPKWTIAWKRGPLLSLIYYYGWQFTLALWLLFKRLPVDVVHNLNFHNDWTPSFLWLLRKPFVWGHVGHHPRVPRNYLLPVFGTKEYIKDRMLWCLKWMFWNLDPFLFITRKKAAVVICMNSDAVKKLRLTTNYIIHPSVAANRVFASGKNKDRFRVLSVGRFVPLKGFDLTIRSFACFYHALSPEQQKNTVLTLVGKGPLKPMLEQLAIQEGIDNAIEWIDWIPKEKMHDIYSDAAVFLFPSHEGAGMVVPEAMSYRIPVLCLNNAGPGELVGSDSPLRVSYGKYNDTIVQLSERLAKLFGDNEFRRQCIIDSEKRYEQLLHWDVRGEMLKNVYDRAISQKNNSNEKSPALCNTLTQ